jgi:hypothetical protein
MRSYQTFPLVPVKRDTADPAGAAPAGVGFAGRCSRAVPGPRPCGTRVRTQLIHQVTAAAKRIAER